MTLIPVCPSKRTSHGAIRKIPQQQRANTAIASENPTRCTQEWYRVPQTIVELIAPGPAINGSARGTTPMLSRTAVSDFSCLFCLSSPSLPLIIDIAMVTTRMPPAIRKESMEIPKICRMPSPRNSDVRRMIATDRLAVRLVLLRTAAG